MEFSICRFGCILIIDFFNNLDFDFDIHFHKKSSFDFVDFDNNHFNTLKSIVHINYCNNLLLVYVLFLLIGPSFFLYF